MTSEHRARWIVPARSCVNTIETMSDQTTETPNTEQSESQDLHRLELQRRANRDDIAALGLLPYGQRTDDLMNLEQAHSAYDEAADQANKDANQARKQAKRDNPDISESDLPELVDDRPRVKVAGRVVLARDNGKLVWLNLRDHSRDAFQIAVSKRDCDEQGFGLAKKLDLGDIVIAEGPITMTNTGEVTCWADTLIPASKCLVPTPEKHAGLTDTEMRYRQRYLDMWVNPETTRVFMLRGELMKTLRNNLDRLDFVEVDTPVLQTQAGGAAARPFFTHMNALDIPLSLRIAPELYLKRLLVGGMPRVFEVSRNSTSRTILSSRVLSSTKRSGTTKRCARSLRVWCVRWRRPRRTRLGAASTRCRSVI